MLLHANLKSIDSVTTIYPNRPGYNITTILPDNTLHKTTVLKAEGDLLLFIKHLKIKYKDTLIDLIEEYRSEVYETGSFDATYEG